MTIQAVPTIDELKADPRRAAGVPARVAAELLADLEGDLLRITRLRDVLIIRVALGDRTPRRENGAEDLVDVDEAARRLGRSKGWLYKHHASLPFVVQEGSGRKLRFSASGIDVYVARLQHDPLDS